jgi:predicted transcriptional regulator
MDIALESLKRLSLDELMDLLMQSTKELVDMIHKEDKAALEAKKKQVQLLQQAIVAKRAEFPPG